MKRFSVCVAMILLAGWMQSCSLPDICDYENGKHYDEHGNCVADTDQECGVYRMDCTKPYMTGVVRGKCEKSMCIATACDEDSSFYLDERINQCILRCECDRYGSNVSSGECNETKIQACIDIECPKENVYCVQNAQELRYLPEWIKQHREGTEEEENEELSVYLLKDIDLGEKSDNGEQGWNAFSIENIKFTAFGDDIKNIRYKDGKLKQGLFDQIKGGVIANIGVDLDVEGDKGVGIFANEVSDSQLYHISVQGKLIYTGQDAENEDVTSIASKLDDVAYCPNGVGGMFGKALNTVLSDISIGADIEIDASKKSLVGGGIGILCNSYIHCDENCVYDIGKVTGNHYVGGMAGLIKNSVLQGTSGIVHEVTGNRNVGGYVGYIHTNSNVVDTVHEYDRILGEENVGGFCGWNRGDMEAVKIKSPIGVVQGKNAVGGLCGNHEGIMEEISSAAREVKGENFVGGMIGRSLGVTEVTHNSVVEHVTGKNSVGGMIGSMEMGALSGDENGIGLLGKHNNVQKVEGQQGVGGVVGVLLNGAVEDLHSSVQEVHGQNLVGGFIGRMGKVVSNQSENDAQFYISNVDNTVALVHDADMAHVDNVLMDGIGGFAGRIERLAQLAYIDNHVEDVISQANKYVGGFAGYQDGVVMDLENDYHLVDGDYSDCYAAGAVGLVDTHAILQNVKNRYSGENSKVSGKGFSAGCVGLVNGIVINVENHANQIISKEDAAGGFSGYISKSGLIKQCQNYTHLVLSSSFGGGFSSEGDGEVEDVYNQVEHVVGSAFLGGAFSGFGGRASSFVSYVGDITQIECKEIESPKEGTYCVSLEYDHEDYQACYENDREGVERCKNSGYVGGFVGLGDGMFNSEYAGVTSMVANIAGSQDIGGFMGVYHYREYSLRNVYFENVASWANVRGERDTGGLFIGKIEDDQALMETNGFYARNIVMMGHYYDALGNEVMDNHLIGAKGIEVDDDGNSRLPGSLNMEYAYTYCYTDNCVYDSDKVTEHFSPIYRPEFTENGETSESVKAVLDILVAHQSNGKRPKVKWSIKQETKEPWQAATENRPVFFVEKDDE